MKNFPVTIKEDLFVDGENMNGKTFWISRSIAVAMFVFSKLNSTWYVLAVKRGEGCPDYQGYWCCPCGYVDYNETILQAVKRELYEETGLKDTNSYRVSWQSPIINDDPDESRQNVTFRFVGELQGTMPVTITPNIDGISVSVTEHLPDLTSDNSEKNEVADLQWIPLGSIDSYQWAFNHKELIFEMFKKL